MKVFTKTMFIVLVVFNLGLMAQTPNGVKINEVFLSNSGDQVELKNFGSAAVNVSSWQLCSRFAYRSIGSLTIVSGQTTIPAGGFLVVSGFNWNNTSADLGLYTSTDFNNPNDMEDFVQWGAAGIGREGEANSAGLWTTGDFVPGFSLDTSIEFDGDGVGSTNWFAQSNPTLGAENGIVTSVADNDGQVPDEFRLAQNYPNPFNPSTRIDYSIPTSDNLVNVALEVFNLLGQKIRTLVNGRQAAGEYSIQWDGRSINGSLVSSGVYIYRLSVANQVITKKMTFLK